MKKEVLERGKRGRREADEKKEETEEERRKRGGRKMEQNHMTWRR